MEELRLQFTRKDPKTRAVVPIMSPDNEAERLHMRTSLRDLDSISIEQGIEIARAMWFAFNPKDAVDISPFITDATVCTRYSVGDANNSQQGTFYVEARLPPDQSLENILSLPASVEFMAPLGLNVAKSHNGPLNMTAVVNTAKPVVGEPKKSLIGKVAEMVLRTLTAKRAATSASSDSGKETDGNSAPEVASA
jgi:hypothetical protein